MLTEMLEKSNGYVLPIVVHHSKPYRWYYRIFVPMQDEEASLSIQDISWLVAIKTNLSFSGEYSAIELNTKSMKTPETFVMDLLQGSLQEGFATELLIHKLSDMLKMDIKECRTGALFKIDQAPYREPYLYVVPDPSS